ncbi:MAG: hypothetical protein ACE5I0_09000 [Candidatus Binatia bacterium]
MYEVERRLFMGIKISPKLQSELDHCVPGTERYFKEDKSEYLQFLTLGEEKFIGRFLRDGFPVSEIDNVSRNVRSLVTLITRGQRIAENTVHIYADCKVRDIVGVRSALPQ